MITRRLRLLPPSTPPPPLARGFFGQRPPDFDVSKDYYKTMGLGPSATDAEIKKAYYRFAKQYHPDANEGRSSEKFKEITNAYNILSDKAKRQQYDSYRTSANPFSRKSSSGSGSYSSSSSSS